ncbi:type III secretion system chaperone [Comamonas flocculans]|uniref:Type III secretion system chaperone n=1 Tax=Comamonas flocculans TaxID=2597701 RepID=A0A5B8RZ61_9BURK|nr:type III secretion system chaperone [Comamonas flocculans]QEA13177.1 type III secretion system chaperone [Comamonas flocculans]
MNTREQAHALLHALGDVLGLPLVPDADGACGLRIDERLELTLRLQEQEAALLAYAQVGALPAARPEAVLRRLLAANHVWEGSQGATWSLWGDQLTLARLWPLQDLDAAGLAQELARFAEVALAEQTRLGAPGGSPPAGAAALPPGVWAA